MEHICAAHPDPATTRATDGRRDCPYNGQAPAPGLEQFLPKPSPAEIVMDAVALNELNAQARRQFVERVIRESGGVCPFPPPGYENAPFEIQLHGIPATGCGVDEAIDNWITKALTPSSLNPAEPASTSSAAPVGG